MASATDPFSAPVVPFEVPEQVRAFAEKGVEQAREQYAKFKDVAEGNNSAIEAAFVAISKGASEYSTKLLSFAQANTYAGFDFAHEIVAVRSLPQAVDIWGSHLRKQFETFTSQAQELAELSRKIATEAAEPLKNSASKAFKSAA
ncbi:MAG: phasin [Rhizobiales bacterium 62-47]|nr:phasin [Hyphomicrobiales bacterium]OJY12357.1 MAG: phasin [Rhizobiales bacterium 62-47]